MRTNRFFVIILATLMALGTLATGCSGCEEDISDPAAADIITSISGFSSVSLGETQRRTLTITNAGAGTLRIHQMELLESRDDEHREFGAVDWQPGDQDITMGPEESREFVVSYTAQDSVEDRGRIEIASNDPAKPLVKVPLEPQPPAAEIFASPSSVIWENVDPSANPSSWRGEPRLVDIQNVGEAPLRVSQIFVSESDAFRVTIPQAVEGEDGQTQYPPDQDLEGEGWPSALAPGEAFMVRVWFRPTDRLAKNGVLVLKSNDVTKPRYEVPLSGNSGAPCLNTSVDEVNFEQGSIGQTTQKTVTVENCSRSEDLELRRIVLSEDAGGVFSVVDDSLPGELNDSPLTIPPREQRNFVVTFAPAASEDYTGTLVIESNDPAARERQIPVIGTGTDNECPTARASATTPRSSRPQTSLSVNPLVTLQLDGTESTDPDGDDSELSYEWTVLSRPQGSTQGISPSPRSATPRFFVDLAGEYEIELKVYDEEGAASCGEPAIIRIDAIPEEDVHVQLVWDTPADPDQTDDFGTDLDLHYMHPQGRWDQEPWDVFWRNKSPDWGVSGDVSDDPSLDIDDTNGAGPENINHDKLQNLIYQTGVYYFADRQLGASYATVRIYVHGVLELELANKYLPAQGAFWRVGFVEWPSGTVQSSSRVYNGFPEN